MEQTKALNALEPFLALTKTTTSHLATADIIARATSSPNTFVFTELLETSAVQNLPSMLPDHRTLLQIFSYGTFMTYKETPCMPLLDPLQLQKLRQLTLLTLAKTKSSGGVLTYSSLMGDLELSTARELEDLVISAIYAGLLKAQLDPKNQKVHIQSISALRDVAPGAVDELLTSLKAWAARCDDTLASLEAQMAQIREDAARRASETAQRQAATERLVEAEKRTAGAIVNSAGGGDGVLLSEMFPTGVGHSTNNALGSGSLGSISAVGPGGALRFGKRGSEVIGGSDYAEVDEGAMDLDDEGESSDSKKRGSKRKLQS